MKKIVMNASLLSIVALISCGMYAKDVVQPTPVELSNQTDSKIYYKTTNPFRYDPKFKELAPHSNVIIELRPDNPMLKSDNTIAIKSSKGDFFVDYLDTSLSLRLSDAQLNSIDELYLPKNPIIIFEGNNAPTIKERRK